MADVSKTIVVMGNYRCGTTWLAEMLAGGLPGYAMVFEPIRAYFPTMRDAGITQWRPHLRSDSVTPAQVQAMESALSGRICKTEKLMRTDRNAVLAASGVVVKFVRGLLSLRWVVEHFGPRHAFVIRRHPCAAVASQFRVKAVRGTPKTMSELDMFFEQHPEIARFEPQSPAQWLAAWWAVSYYAALSTPQPHPWSVVKYEDLCGSPENVLRDVFGPLGVTPSNTEALVSRLSLTAKTWSTGAPTPWMRYLGPSNAKQIWDVVQRFPLITEGYDGP